MEYAYTIFGLNTVSSIRLPAQVLSPDTAVGCADVAIAYGNVPDGLEHARFKGVRFQAGPGEFLLRVDNIARYYVRNGNEITIAPEPGAHEEDIRVFLMGSVMGALLHQRDVLVLHAGAVEVDGKGVIFTGPSGMGKSTLTAGFQRKGYPFLTDDLCAVSNGNGFPAVQPGFHVLQLWSDVLHGYGEKPGTLESVRWGSRIEKYFVPVCSQQTVPLPVKDVFILSESDQNVISVTELKGPKKVNILAENTYRLNFTKGFDSGIGHFHHCVQLGAKARIFHAMRPSGRFLLNELVEAVEENIYS
jgi:hypothetical protein